MIRLGLLVGLVLSLFATDAYSCQRCGLFGRRCQFSQQVHHVQHVAQVVAVPAYVAPVASPEVLVVNNQYAAPNGAAAFLAPQGQTVYGLQAAAQAYTLDPSAVLRQAAELTKGAQQLAGQGLSGYQQTATVALQLNAGTNDTIARGVAASSILQSAGLSGPSAQNQTQALRIYRDDSGKWAVEQGESVVARITSSVQQQSAESPATVAGAAGAVAGPLASEHLGDYSYSSGQADAGMAYGAMTLSAEALEMLRDFTNYGFEIAS